MTLDSLKADLVFAEDLAEAARDCARSRFRAGLQADNKDAGGFDRVTEADRAIEARLRALIENRYPLDAVLGEEGGHTQGTSGRTWVLDPIDGTRAFIAGVPTWTVLISLTTQDHGPVLSVIDQPHIGERFCAIAHDGHLQAELVHEARRRALTTRSTKHLKDALAATTDPYLFKGAEADAFEAVRGRVRLMRFGLDAYAYAMIAAGGLDLVVESELQPWDIAALVPVVRGAGGVVTDWRGRDTFETGQVVAAATAALHREALDVLRPAAR